MCCSSSTVVGASNMTTLRTVARVTPRDKAPVATKTCTSPHSSRPSAAARCGPDISPCSDAAAISVALVIAVARRLAPVRSETKTSTGLRRPRAGRSNARSSAFFSSSGTHRTCRRRPGGMPDRPPAITIAGRRSSGKLARCSLSATVAATTTRCAACGSAWSSVLTCPAARRPLEPTPATSSSASSTTTATRWPSISCRSHLTITVTRRAGVANTSCAPVVRRWAMDGRGMPPVTSAVLMCGMPRVKLLARASSWAHSSREVASTTASMAVERSVEGSAD
mmetsp:Transcript_24410/g.78418  ORF Transcript_24410/g.78418 Transcript_24410/m.78418 type:complete len:281 (+) Transcript_24410:374-1216(+)